MWRHIEALKVPTTAMKVKRVIFRLDAPVCLVAYHAAGIVIEILICNFHYVNSNRVTLNKSSRRIQS